jgi:polysaccharide pyruvyl transferase WcaK-like protein
MYRAEDEGESHRLCSKFGGAVASYISEGDALGLIARSRLVCAMRFHALLFASMNDIPFVAFGKDPKVREFEGI